MNSKIIISNSLEELSENFAQLLTGNLDASGKYFNLTLSGGTTPKFIFEYLAENYKTRINWRKIKLFWGDERCVPPDNAESNYKTAYDSLISKIDIPHENIFRIHGEVNPEEEAKNYSNVIVNNVPSFNNFPQFDMIMLGLGEDGHTASIFPDNLKLFNSDILCAVAEHPATYQKRITLTGRVINNAKKIAFLVTGKSKCKILNQLLNKINGYDKLPASYIQPVSGELIWLLDDKAGSLLNNP